MHVGWMDRWRKQKSILTATVACMVLLGLQEYSVSILKVCARLVSCRWLLRAFIQSSNDQWAVAHFTHPLTLTVVTTKFDLLSVNLFTGSHNSILTPLSHCRLFERSAATPLNKTVKETPSNPDERRDGQKQSKRTTSLPTETLTVQYLLMRFFLIICHLPHAACFLARRIFRHFNSVVFLEWRQRCAHVVSAANRW